MNEKFDVAYLDRRDVLAVMARDSLSQQQG